jgi:hypothetical protein
MGYKFRKRFAKITHALVGQDRSEMDFRPRSDKRIPSPGYVLSTILFAFALLFTEVGLSAAPVIVGPPDTAPHFLSRQTDTVALLRDIDRVAQLENVRISLKKIPVGNSPYGMPSDAFRLPRRSGSEAQCGALRCAANSISPHAAWARAPPLL